MAPADAMAVEPCNDPPNEAAAEYVEFMFKDQFVSRAGCGASSGWSLADAHVGQHVAVGACGLRRTCCERVAVLWCFGVRLCCGFTRLTFRDQIFTHFLVERAIPEWEPTGGGRRDSCPSGWSTGSRHPLQRWRKPDVNHSLSVVLFAASLAAASSDTGTCYRVVLENEAASKRSLPPVSALKRELVAFAAS